RPRRHAVVKQPVAQGPLPGRRGPAAAEEDPVLEPRDVPEPAHVRRRAGVPRQPDDALEEGEGVGLLHADRNAVASPLRRDLEAAAQGVGATAEGYGRGYGQWRRPARRRRTACCSSTVGGEPTPGL